MKRIALFAVVSLALACSSGSEEPCGTFVFTSDAALPDAAYCVTAGDEWNACDSMNPWSWANATDPGTKSCTLAATNATLRCQDADPCYMPNGVEGRCYNTH